MGNLGRVSLHDGSLSRSLDWLVIPSPISVAEIRMGIGAIDDKTPLVPDRIHWYCRGERKNEMEE